MASVSWVLRCLSFVVAALLLGYAPAAAQPSAGQPASSGTLPEVVVAPGQSIPVLRDHIRYRPIAPSTAVGDVPIATLRPLSHRSTQFGPPGDLVVGAVALRNGGTAAGSWILTTGRGTVDELELYRDDGAGPTLLFDRRDTAALGRSLSAYQAIAQEVTLDPGERTTILFRFRDRSSSWMPLGLSSFGDFMAARRANIAMVAAVIVGSLILLLINALMFAVTGQRNFAWLAAAEVAFALNTFYAEGYATIAGLYRWPAAAMLAGEITRPLFALLMLQFGRLFVDTRRLFPRFDLALRALLGASLAVIAATVVELATGSLDEYRLHSIGWLIVAVVVMVMPAIGVLAVRQRRDHWPLLVGWTAMSGYIAYMLAAMSGQFPGLVLAWHWIGPIGLFECLMATLAMAIHVRRIADSRLAAERTAREALLSKLAMREEVERLAGDRDRALVEIDARDKLLEGSAHDTRHVLHALNSAVHFGRSKAGRQRRADDFIPLLEASARHLEDVIASSVSIGNRDGRFLALCATDLKETLRSLAAIYDPIARRLGVELAIDDDAGGPAILDEPLVARMLSNLLNNALKFTRDGAVRLRCEREPGLLRLTVSDSGSGMRAELARWLNDHAGGDQPAPAELGLGTGWRALREIVALSRGSYEIETGPDQTSVAIILPNPLDGAIEPLDIAGLARAHPGFQLRDIDDKGPPGPDQGPLVMVADEGSHRVRVAAAARSPLLLVRPLCAAMLDHPYAAELSSRPAARAHSTS